MHRLTPAFFALPLLALTAACAGPPALTPAQASASAEAAHEKQVRQEWAAAVARRKTDLAQFTKVVVAAVAPFGVTPADLIRASSDTAGETSACGLNYNLHGPIHNIAGLPVGLVAALKSAGWDPESSASPDSVNGVALDRGNWKVFLRASPETDPVIIKAVGFQGFNADVWVHSSDHGC